MDMDYKKVYEEWLTNPFFDEATRQELAAIKDDEKEIKERFYTDLNSEQLDCAVLLVPVRTA